MALSLIGAGFGRTGTLSLKHALETLGFRCHHMIEVIRSPEGMDKWMTAAEQGNADWDEMLRGFDATVDWPCCHFYKQLAETYPDARVLLNVRDPRTWYESMSSTTLRVIRERMKVAPDSRNLGQELVVKGAFDGNIDDPDHAVEIFEAHVREVRATIEPERLLVYEVAEGWEPLCEFLGVPVPDEPFPRLNSRDEFDEIFFGGRS